MGTALGSAIAAVVVAVLTWLVKRQNDRAKDRALMELETAEAALRAEHYLADTAGQSSELRVAQGASEIRLDVPGAASETPASPVPGSKPSGDLRDIVAERLVERGEDAEGRVHRPGSFRERVRRWRRQP